MIQIIRFGSLLLKDDLWDVICNDKPEPEMGEWMKINGKAKQKKHGILLNVTMKHYYCQNFIKVFYYKLQNLFKFNF